MGRSLRPGWYVYEAARQWETTRFPGYHLRVYGSNAGHFYAWHIAPGEAAGNDYMIGSRDDLEEAMDLAESIVPGVLHLAQAAEDNPKKRTFSPSYEASTQEEYDERVAECAPYTHLPWDQRPKGCKRTKHEMLPGGRRGARYDEEEEPLTPATKARWAGDLPPFPTRTQSPAVRERVQKVRQREAQSGGRSPKLRSLTLQIARALLRYRQQSGFLALGLLVPQTEAPLKAVGMPLKAAGILVSRGKGLWFPASSPKARVSSASDQLRQGFGARLQISGYEVFLVDRVSQKKLTLQELAISPTGDDSLLKVLVDDEGIKKAHDAWKRRGGWQRDAAERLMREDDYAEAFEKHGENLDAWPPDVRLAYAREMQQLVKSGYSAPTHDPRFLDKLLKGVGAAIQKQAAAWGNRPITVEGVFSDREFSFPLRDAAIRDTPDPKVTHRTLGNVSLSELPHFLARLSLRKKSRGRTLKPLSPTARDNPMPSDNPLLEMLKASGGTAPVPGKPGRVYYYSHRKGYIVETTQRRADSWIALGEKGKAAQQALREKTGRLPRQSVAPRLQAPVPQRAKVITKKLNPRRENPRMSHFIDDEDFWFSQYSSSPFGGRQSIPAARRNPAKKNGGKRAPSAYNLFVGDQMRSGKSMKQAAAAWKRSKNNPRKAAPKSRRSAAPKGRALGVAKKGYKSSYHHPVYEQQLGPFGVSERHTHGLQPANRRNPKGKAKIGYWPGECCMCGGETKGTQIVQHPSMRGPKGGKKYAHVNCV